MGAEIEQGRENRAKEIEYTMELNKKAYDKYIKQITPVNELGSDMLRAFVTGGIICALGAGLGDDDDELPWNGERRSSDLDADGTDPGQCPADGFWHLSKNCKMGRAGALVPITGFANSVVAPAIEYKAEGHVFGIGCKIFTIAGPVILFGVLTSWILGIILLIGKVLGIA